MKKWLGLLLALMLFVCALPAKANEKISAMTDGTYMLSTDYVHIDRPSDPTTDYKAHIGTMGSQDSSAAAITGGTLAGLTSVAIGTSSASVSLDLTGETDAIKLPAGTSAQRPTAAAGQIRYNSSTPGVEAYYSGVWNTLGSGGSSTITLGTAASSTNPQRSGDAKTGFYSAAAGHVTAGVNVSGTGTLALDIFNGGINIPSGSVYEVNGSQIACANLSNGATGCSTATGTSGATIALLNGNNTQSGTEIFSAQVTHNVASTIASATSATLDDVDVAAATATVTSTTHITTAKGFNKVSIYKPTITDSSSVTIDNSATLYIDAAPLQAGSVTITNAYALWVASGATNLGGTLAVSGTLAAAGLGTFATVDIGSTAAVTTGSVLDMHSVNTSMILPTGTAAQRPTPIAGMIRYDSDTPAIEAYYNSTWNTLGSGGGGMVYPGAGIPVSTGSSWSTSITSGTGVQTALGNAVDTTGGFQRYGYFFNTSDFSVTSNTTPAQITGISATLTTGHSYIIWFQFSVSQTAAAGGKMGWGGTATCSTFTGTWQNLDSGSNDITAPTAALATVFSYTSNGTSGLTEGHVYCVCSGTGSIFPTYSQNTTNAGASLVKAGSFINVQQVN